MVESDDVLGLMKVVYAIYVTVVVCLIGLYGLRVTRGVNREPTAARGRLYAYGFYVWIGVLVFVGVGLHALTYDKIPWVKWDLRRHQTQVDREFKIAIADYAFHLPSASLNIVKGQMVRFNLESKDYTYGFGLFREDGTMVFQMQVVPGSRNDLVWKFDESNNYTIRSTEYSGPKGGNLVVRDAVVVAAAESGAVASTDPFVPAGPVRD